MNYESRTIETKTIGIIGYGNFGKVISQYLFPNNKIFVYSRSREQKSLFPTITCQASIQELVELSDIIIPAVPIGQFEHVVKEISQFVKSEQTVIDVCSVKQYPVEVMKKYLEGKTHLIATHPMFGPNSIKQRNNTITNLSFVISNINCESSIYDTVKNHFTDLDLHVIEMSPEEHDKLSAHSQFFAMMVGQFAQRLGLKHTEIDTPGASAIFDALQYMGPDQHIIEDMITYNVYCRTILKEMIKTLEELYDNSSQFENI